MTRLVPNLMLDFAEEEGKVCRIHSVESAKQEKDLFVVKEEVKQTTTLPGNFVECPL